MEHDDPNTIEEYNARKRQKVNSNFHAVEDYYDASFRHPVVLNPDNIVETFLVSNIYKILRQHHMPSFESCWNKIINFINNQVNNNDTNHMIQELSKIILAEFGTQNPLYRDEVLDEQVTAQKAAENLYKQYVHLKRAMINQPNLIQLERSFKQSVIDTFKRHKVYRCKYDFTDSIHIILNVFNANRELELSVIRQRVISYTIDVFPEWEAANHKSFDCSMGIIDFLNNYRFHIFKNINAKQRFVHDDILRIIYSFLVTSAHSIN